MAALVLLQFGSRLRIFYTNRPNLIYLLTTDCGAAADGLVACWFVRGAIGVERYVQMVNAPIGMEMTADEFVKVGEGTANLVWMFNAREGFTTEMTCFPRETERIEADFIKS